MTANEIFEVLVSEFGSAVSDLKSDVKDPYCLVQSSALSAVALRLRDDPRFRFDFLQCLTGVDYPKEGKIAVVYHFFSYSLRHGFVVKVMADRTKPVVPSLTSVWKVANWHERECYDLLGVFFEGHPDLRRILLPDDWIGHPLRKDYAEPDQYRGIPTTRPNPVELFAIQKAPEKAPS